MQAHGKLSNHHIIITKPKDVGRFYTKSRFGIPQQNNTLYLNFLEAAFLVAEKKLIVHKNKQTLHFQDLVDIAATQIPCFDLYFQVFSDLRKRGHTITLSPETHPSTFTEKRKTKHHTTNLHVFVFSEHDTIDVFTIKTLTETNHAAGIFWFALVDDEGDITYYSVSFENPSGTLEPQHYPKTTGLLIKDRVIISNSTLSSQLFSEEFYGKPFEDGLQLSLLEALYLVQHNMLTVLDSDKVKIKKTHLKKKLAQHQPDLLSRYQVYHDLKQRHLIVKTGFKFGTHFRAYTEHPDKTHAKYMIHLIAEKSVTHWSEISRAVRLAHAVNKNILFALFGQKTIHYLTFIRVRP